LQGGHRTFYKNARTSVVDPDPVGSASFLAEPDRPPGLADLDLDPFQPNVKLNYDT
jgi:hypothetical protein